MRLPWKTEGSLNLPDWIYTFYYSGFLNNLLLPWKTECPGIFHCIEYTFNILNFWATCACPEKQSALEFFTVLNIRYTFTSFEQLSLALKNRAARNFRWIEYTFTFRIFEQFASACPENQSCPDIFHCIWTCIFIIQGFWATSACPEKQRLPEFTVLNIYFL